jgi:hypothetical protein
MSVRVQRFAFALAFSAFVAVAWLAASPVATLAEGEWGS